MYINDYEHVPELESGLTAYFRFYDEERPHQSLDYQTPGGIDRVEVRGGRRPESFNKCTWPEWSIFWGPP